MGTSGGTTNSSVSGDSSSSQQTTVDQSRNVYDDMKKTLETMLTPQKGRFWLSASTGTLTVTDIAQLKLHAHLLRKKLQAEGTTLKTTHAQELVACKYGFSNWQTAIARLKS